MNEMGNLLCNGRLPRLQPRSQTGDPTHDRVVAHIDHDARGRALDGVGGEEGQVLGLAWVVVGAVRGPGLGFRFTGQGGVVNLD